MKKSFFPKITLSLFATLISLNVMAIDLKKNPTIQHYINQISKEHQLDKKQLQQWFSEAKFNPVVIQKMEKPYEALPWYRYQELYVDESRITNGIDFWNKNQQALSAAEKKYGVPASVIVAIIGVETRYGKRMGDFKVFDTLMTLAFDYPKRAKFFKKELTQFILLSKEQQWDPLTINGSYAGAIGMGQFMPSSYRHYAVDFTNSGHKDLLHNDADAIGSVANYLKVHKWQAKQPIAVPAKVTKRGAQKATDKSTKPELTIAQLKRDGIQPIKPLAATAKAALYKFDDHDKASYWLGLENFYAITRYNTSPKYALAVTELANKIKQQRNGKRT